MNKYLVPGIIILVLLVAGYFLFNNLQQTNLTSKNMDGQNISGSIQSSNYKFSNPKKSAHYESNTPAHGSVLADLPVNIVIDFNFDLAKPSSIQIIRDVSGSPEQSNTGMKVQGAVYGNGETLIDANKLSMRRGISPNSPDGLFTVKYNACWPDGSCHDGSFEFAIDRTQANAYIDQTGKKEITIKMSEIMFKPKNIKVSKGTKIMWINDDNVGHYVNTDSHPAHTYYPTQNSKILKKGESYSLTFNQTGIYPYHCSTHASSMVGNLLVE